VALQGTLDTFALPDVLRLLAATKKTGRLRITGGRGTGSVWVESGAVSALEATHAPHANEAVDALFELLRFEDGAFTFDAEALHDDAGTPTDVELLLHQSEALLSEWREIESVVPSMDAWVTLRRTLPQPEVSLDQERWTTVVAVGAGATVRRVADELCLSELPVSRAIKDLVEQGLFDIELAAPASAAAPTAAPIVGRPLLNGDSAPAPKAAPKVSRAAVEPVVEDEEPEPPARPAPRARKPKAEPAEPGEPERFVPLELPGHSAQMPSYDPVDDDEEDDLAAAFPGLANRASAAHAADLADDEADDIARQLATLSPRAANAVRAAAEATTEEERDAALAEVDDDDEPLNRGLLLKFLSSVKS
jgi:Domain of unknown function (DUF4388)